MWLEATILDSAYVEHFLQSPNVLLDSFALVIFAFPSARYKQESPAWETL